MMLIREYLKLRKQVPYSVHYCNYGFVASRLHKFLDNCATEKLQKFMNPNSWVTECRRQARGVLLHYRFFKLVYCDYGLYAAFDLIDPNY